MQMHTEFREIPRNSGKFYCKKYREIPRNSEEFRGIPFVFQKIPYSVGSQKRTSVDTLSMTRVYRVHFENKCDLWYAYFHCRYDHGTCCN